MNIVNVGDVYQVYGDGIKTYREIPLGTYEVEFNQMKGFYLSKRSELRVSEEKVYGSHLKKVNKILDAFARGTAI